MYVRRTIKPQVMLLDSWRLFAITVPWSALVVYLHEIRGWETLSVPFLPVSTIGIAVSLYLGFKSTSAYNRWWEARSIWGEVVNNSRTWANYAHNMVHDADYRTQPAICRELIVRHIAWINALAYQLRKNSRLKISDNMHIFDFRRDLKHPDYHADPQSYLKHLTEEERTHIPNHANPATHILRLQGEHLRALAKQGLLSDFRFVEMTSHLGKFYDCQGKSERIKNTPFPRQIAYFGTVFTWIFILLLPIAFVDAFEDETARHHLDHLLAVEYMFMLVPFTSLIAWIFYVIEKVSDSSEDPFEGGASDVPISTLCRTIEIDMKQFLNEGDIPPPLKPLDGIAY